MRVPISSGKILSPYTNSIIDNPTFRFKIDYVSKIQSLLLIPFIILASIGTSTLEAQTIIICSQTTGNYNINGPGGDDVRAKLSNLANFGPTGDICNYEFEYLTVGDNFTEAIVNTRGCQIWWSGFETDGSYTPSERTEILSWISNGGLVMAGCDAPSHDPICEILGLELSGFPSGGSGESILDIDLRNNCFPNTAATGIVNGGGALDAFSEATSSQYQVITRLESNFNNIPELNGLATTIYADGVFATSDVNMFTGLGCCLTDGPELTNSNDFFMGEAICILAKDAAGEGNCIEESIRISNEPEVLIPLMSQWALFILGLLLSNLAIVFLHQRRNSII